MRLGTLLQIANSTWMLAPSHVESLAMAARNVFSGVKAFADDDEDENADPKSYGWIVNDKGDRVGEITDNIPDSVAVIELNGVVMKYDYCGAAGTQTLAKLLQQANDNPSVTAIVFVVDSPGGSVAGTQEFATALKNSGKPVVTYADLMCSAAMWLGSSTDYRIASSETSTIGSIGTMCSWYDFKGYLDKEGIKKHEVYATDSSEKNRPFREAEGNNAEGKSNYSPMIKTWLDPLNGVFTSTVKANLPGVDASVLNGAVFIGKDAVDKGLIDAIGTFQSAIAKARELGSGSAQQSLTQTKTQITMKWKNFLALIGLASAVASASDIKLTDANVDSMEALIEERDQLKTSLAAATAESDGLKTQLAALQKESGDKSTEIASLKGQVEALGKKDGAEPTVVSGAKDTDPAIKDNVEAGAMDFQKDLYARL